MPTAERARITSSGQYTPPSYLTANSVQVTITAALTSTPSTKSTATVTVTPGFLQPLTPENAALGASGTLTVTGYLAEAGGSLGITYGLSSTASGSSGGQGSLSTPSCVRSSQSFTHCTVIYTAPTTSFSHRRHVHCRYGREFALASDERGSAEHGRSIEQSRHSRNDVGSASFTWQLGREQQRLRHIRQPDCGLLRRDAGIADPELEQHAIHSEQQSRAGAERPGNRTGEMIVQPGLIDDNCTPYGQTRHGHHAGGHADRIPAAEVEFDQR